MLLLNKEQESDFNQIADNWIFSLSQIMLYKVIVHRQWGWNWCCLNFTFKVSNIGICEGNECKINAIHVLL